MKNIKYCIIVILILLTSTVKTQTISVSVDTTSKSDTLNSEIIFNFDITNVSSTEQTADIVRTVNDLPDGWSSSLCFALCFAPQVDSISTTSDYGSSPLSAGEKREFTFHVFPKDNDGTAQIELKVKNTANPLEAYTFQLTANTGVSAVEVNNRTNIYYGLDNNYPNPFNPSTNISYMVGKAGNVKINLYNSLGQFIKTLVNEYKTKGKYRLKIDMKNYSNGNYFVTYSVNDFYKVQKITLEK